MKKQILIVAGLCVVIGLAGTTVHAQVVQAKVPFNFVVSGKTLPAGEYMMSTYSHELKIKDGKGTIVAFALVNDSGRSASGKGQIIFHCYRDRCFLAEVWSPTRENGRELMTSRAEAALAREEPGKYFAVLGTKPRE